MGWQRFLTPIAKETIIYLVLSISILTRNFDEISKGGRARVPSQMYILWMKVSLRFRSEQDFEPNPIIVQGFFFLLPARQISECQANCDRILDGSCSYGPRNAQLRR